mmetsp:Transcript_7602/g.28506  ORF Transcript_7602/g.28506 Transcript_7602/m.28506 type:complete len:314 (+) Transcript_7602:336-1277(+)
MSISQPDPNTSSSESGFVLAEGFEDELPISGMSISQPLPSEKGSFSSTGSTFCGFDFFTFPPRVNRLGCRREAVLLLDSSSSSSRAEGSLNVFDHFLLGRFVRLDFCCGTTSSEKIGWYCVFAFALSSLRGARAFVELASPLRMPDSLVEEGGATVFSSFDVLPITRFTEDNAHENRLETSSFSSASFSVFFGTSWSASLSDFIEFTRDCIVSMVSCRISADGSIIREEMIGMIFVAMLAGVCRDCVSFNTLRACNRLCLNGSFSAFDTAGSKIFSRVFSGIDAANFPVTMMVLVRILPCESPSRAQRMRTTI